MINNTDKIVEALSTKACLKQQIFAQGKEIFNELKSTLKQVIEELEPKLQAIDQRVLISYKDKSEFEAEITFGGDILLFSFHTNVFAFENTHEVNSLPYIQENDQRAYFNMIQVHNFLADSLKYNRLRDLGYLIARVFINIDKHFFVEGKRQLGFLYNDVSSMELNSVYIRAIIEAAILHTIDFDLFVPPYQEVQEITVQQHMVDTLYTQQSTAKRLGFQFSNLQD